LLVAVVGAVVTVPLLFVVTALMGGGHGTYIPAIAIFPFGMLVSMALTGQITWLSMVVAVAQFPAYGYLAGGESRKARLAMLVVHAVAVIVAFWLKPGSNFD
jgi:hypothetical protein